MGLVSVKNEMKRVEINVKLRIPSQPFREIFQIGVYLRMKTIHAITGH